MRKIIEITVNSFLLALQELWKNKLRTFLSLFGVTIGIFCIISVLATVNSLKNNIQKEIKTLGSNTIYVDKWDYNAGNGPEYPWWKYQKRPYIKISDLNEIMQRSSTISNGIFFINTSSNADVGDYSLNNVRLYGVTQGFELVQPVEIQTGRFLTTQEFSHGSNSIVIGDEVASNLFGQPEFALNKVILIKGKKNIVVGIMKKQGKKLIGGWNFDKSIILPYQYARTIMDETKSDPLIIVKGKENISSKVVKDELESIMRSIRKLNPVQDENFALNDINDFSETMEKAFASVNIGGWAIGALSFIVGIFGVANIMFVTVKERTSQIGLKKAIGAKNNLILTEFLLESSFLCIIGGLIGLLLVYLLTLVVTHYLNFPITLSFGIILTALSICIVAGVVAGFVPALRASKLDPVVAIRSQ